MDRIHDSLVEAGLVNHWLMELFETSMKKARLEAVLKREAARERGKKEEDSFLLGEEEVTAIKGRKRSR